MNKTVQYFDLGTGQVSTIPVEELAPGTVRVFLHDVGPVWTDIKHPKFRCDSRPLHKPFSSAGKKLIKEKIMQPLAEVRPMPLELWEYGFRCDVNPEPQMAIWIVIARRYQEFLKTHPGLIRAQRQEAFLLISGATFCTSVEEVLASNPPLRFLSRLQAEETLEPFKNNWRPDGREDDALVAQIRRHDFILARLAGKEKLELLWAEVPLETLKRAGWDSVPSLQLEVPNENELEKLRALVAKIKQHGYRDSK
jgi:hypothetical protein